MSKIATRGWRYHRCGPIAQVLKLESFDLPVSKDQVVVKVSRTPLHRVDSAIVNGSALGHKKATVAAFPRIGGCEAVGTVVRPGASKSVKEGDSVWVAPITGAWAETIVADASLVHKIDPKHSSLATTASNLVMAQHLLSSQRLGAGDVVVQNGGSSLTALAIAALAQDRKLTVISAALPGDRFTSSAARLKTFGSALVPYTSKGALGAKAAMGTKSAALFLNGVGGSSFNDFVKLLGANGNVVSFGAQNSFGLMWAGSNQIYNQLTFQGFYLPRYLQQTPYQDRQHMLDSVLHSLAGKKFSYPIDEVKGLAQLPTVWDKSFVSGGAKGILVL